MQIVDEALASLPAALREKIDNVEIRVVRAPTRRQSRGPGGEPGGALYGLYEGIPYGQRGPDYQMELPDRITLFRDAIERSGGTRKERVRCIQETVLHEIGHYFGLDDDALEELGVG